MKEEIKLFFKQLVCRHDWYFAGTGDDKESYWYWHFELCDNCGRQREVMNNHNYDACGHITGEKK